MKKSLIVAELASLKERQNVLEKMVNISQTKDNLPTESLEHHQEDELISKKVFSELVSDLEIKLMQVNLKIEVLMERTNTLCDTLKSFKDLKKELKAFFTINGYSKLLRTKSLFKKIFWLIYMITLFIVCMFFVDESYKEFKAFNVVTQVKVKENETLLFPAVSICIGYAETINYEKFNLTQQLTKCTFETLTRRCSANDFQYFEIENALIAYPYQCYKFNGGKNSSNHEIPLLTLAKFGSLSGLKLVFNDFPTNGFVMYHVGDNKVHLVQSDLRNIVSPGKRIFVGIEKTVDIKLPKPYSNCEQEITLESSHLAKQIIRQNITYSKKYCYDLCLKEYASGQNISIGNAYKYLNFNYQGNCSQYCPLECQSNTFEMTVSQEMYKNKYQKLVMDFDFLSNRYTEITQAIKTTGADLISNTGGTLGLFLDWNFISIHRLIVDILDIFVF